MHAVDIEEKRQHEEQQALVLHDALHRSLQAGNSGAQHMVGALFAVQLLHVLGDRHRKNHPPHCGDDERNLHAELRIDAEARSSQNYRQARNERDARTDVAPGVAVGRNFVIAFFGGGIYQKGIVEHH